ncbi:alpha/beta fold hydrolase [Rhizohabitans arisaemae]|uniref:alpha/beta fold hydrolase n=1 Tax=Rhizohabitans arisaemae TaxID=2720610 RepID=UPI0024B1B370|nr:alpha/beta hydrolase [Rhizohabitans arisaemae]
MERTYVLVPGAWMGAWVWEPVAERLRALGHQARSVTLSGLDDASSEVSSIGLATHVDDVLAVLEEHDLRDVIVVGHGYSGVVVGQVADRAPDRVAHTVFIEAFLPHYGRSMLDAFPAGVREFELQAIADNGGRWPAPPVMVAADGQDLSVRQARSLVARFVGHPGRTISEPAVLSRPLEELSATYIVCEKDHFDGAIAADVQAMRSAPNWTFHTLQTGHWPMVSRLDRLTCLLAEATANG